MPRLPVLPLFIWIDFQLEARYAPLKLQQFYAETTLRTFGLVAGEKLARGLLNLYFSTQESHEDQDNNDTCFEAKKKPPHAQDKREEWRGNHSGRRLGRSKVRFNQQGAPRCTSKKLFPRRTLLFRLAQLYNQPQNFERLLRIEREVGVALPFGEGDPQLFEVSLPQSRCLTAIVWRLRFALSM
jgi:hypothetical protein